MSVDILSVDCLKFLNKLNELFEGPRQRLLGSRNKMVGYRSSTKEIRESDWKCAEIPEDLKDRTVEITGPVVPAKMVINALNSGANCYMADFEDSLSPTWKNILAGHWNMVHAVEGSLTSNGKEIGEDPAVLHVRPRGLHLNEDHMFGMSASLFDFGVNFFNTVYRHMAHGTKPYYYIPKLEQYEEAEWWKEVFEYAEWYMDVPHGTIRCTVLIETLPAVFQMDEILWELKDYAAGLNCGRWDYIFSMIKCMPDTVMPNRSAITMYQTCMEAYSRLLVATCQRRGVAAMGGMAAQIPIKNDPEANDDALSKVTQDKLLEVARGHDGTWVAHPGLIEVARNAFEARLSDVFAAGAKIEVREAKRWGMKELLQSPTGVISTAELDNNVAVALQYITSWLEGNGCVAINNLMEDAATAEIARAQVWQWLRHNKVTKEAVVDSMRKASITTTVGPKTAISAINLFEALVFAESCPEFLTVQAYEILKSFEEKK